MALDMTMDLAGLARAQAHALGDRPLHIAWYKVLARLSQDSLGRWIASSLMRRAQRLQAAAIWFKGASAELHEKLQLEQIDPDDALRHELDALALQLIRTSDEASNVVDMLVRKDGHEHGAVRDALRVVAAAAQDLKSEIRDFAGAVRAHDANVCAIASARARTSRHHVTPEALDAAMDRLTS